MTLIDEKMDCAEWWVRYGHSSGLAELYAKTDHHYDPKRGILNQYHLEGDVWTHTQMVLNQLDQVRTSTGSYQFYFQYEDWVELYALAFFHDLGKCYTRTEDHEKTKVHFIGHGGVSALKAPDYLVDLKFDDSTISRMAFIICHHQEMFGPVNKQETLFPKVPDAYSKEKPEVLRKLFVLMYADATGRISSRKETGLESGYLFLAKSLI